MCRAACVAWALVGVLLLAGCTGEEKGYGKEITSSAETPKVNIDAETAKIQANEHMPPAAKEAAIANLQRGQTLAAAQTAAKSTKK